MIPLYDKPPAEDEKPPRLALPHELYLELRKLMPDLPADSVAAVTLRIRPDQFPTVTLVLYPLATKDLTTRVTKRFRLVHLDESEQAEREREFDAAGGAA